MRILKTEAQESVEAALEKNQALLQKAEDLDELHADAFQKFADLVEWKLKALLPTHRRSMEDVKDLWTNVLLPAFEKQRAQFPFLTAESRALQYLVRQALMDIAADGVLLKGTNFRVNPTRIHNLDTNEAWASSQPIYETIGGNRNSTRARNRPRRCQTGDRIVVDPGSYPNFRLTWVDGLGVPCAPEVPWTVIMARRLGEVYIEPQPGDLSMYHGIYHEHFDWPVEIRNFVIHKASNAAVGSENPASDRFSGSHPGFAPMRYRNLRIEGTWDAERTPLIVDGKTVPLDSNGVPCTKLKWGGLLYQHGIGRTRDEPGLDVDGLDVSGVWEEHGFAYCHNLFADAWDHLALRVRNFKQRWCGRTDFQFVNRVNEGPAGKGRVEIEDGYLEDCCLQQGGGGFHITIAGRHYGGFYLSRITSRQGCNPRLAPPRNANITGALVVYCGNGSDDIPTSDVVVDQCDFEVGQFFPGQGSARRSLVKVGNDPSFEEQGKELRKVVERFTMTRTRLKGWPGTREVFNVSSPTSCGTLRLAKPIAIDPVNGNDVGQCMFAGQKFATYAEMLNSISGLPGVVIL